MNTTLTELNLKGNSLGEGGGQTIAAALRENHTLTELNLGYNSLGEGGGQAIAAALRVNTTLTDLNLEHNSLGEGAEDRPLLRHCAKITRSQSSTFEHNSLEEGGESVVCQSWGNRGGTLEL